MASSLKITAIDGVGVATLMARRDADLTSVAAALSFERLPDDLACAWGAEISLISTGPSVWLALADRAEPGWAGELAKTLAAKASVSDQSSSYAIWQLAGKDARGFLQRGVSIDLSEDAFGPNSAVVTAIEHIGAIIWVFDDVDVFHVAVFRSYRASFEHWMSVTSSE